MDDEYIMAIQQDYDAWLMDTEGRGSSWGEIAYIESLNKKELAKMRKELDEWLDSKEDNDGTI